MDGKYFYKNQAINNDYNQKAYIQSMILPQGNNKNKSPYDKFLNKYSYTYLHTKKLNNINKTNNYQSLIDCTEPEPQIFHDFHQNNDKNNSFDIIQNKKDKIMNNKSQIPITPAINNRHITNRNNNKKLLEEYFQLKNRNSYNTLNSAHNNPKKIEYNPLNKKNKIKRNSNKNEVKDKNIKKSKSLKNDLLQIYEPEKNMTNSPSFTPIKNKYPNSKKMQTKENNPSFNSKSNINKKSPINNSSQRKKFNNKILKSEEAIINSKRIKNIKDDSKYRMGNRTPTTTRKNLAPTKIKGIWIDQNDINYNKTDSIDKSNNSNPNINNYIYSSSYLHSNYSNNNNNNISINSTELYWKRKEKEKEKKLEQIRTERILKEEKELQDRPKINQNSKKILDRRGIKNVDVFNRLSDLSQIKNHNIQMEKIREKLQESHTPFINDNSRRMKRTIDDLYSWKNQNERKKTESANNFNKMIKRKQIKINPLSEEILREKKSDYLNKRVEDRLLEQGRMQQYKNEMERQKYLNFITTSKKYVNNEYINIHSRYLESPNSTNNNLNNYNQKNYKSCERINKKETKNNYKNKNLSINNNFENSFNNYEDNSNYNNDINSFNNQNMSEKEIYFKNNESKLINGNINNYIYRNNNINDYIVKQQKDNIQNNPNLLIVKKQSINNNYKYFPINANNNEVLNNKKENSNYYKSNYNTENNFNHHNNKNKLHNQNYIKGKGSFNLINKSNNIKEDNSNNISYKDNTFNNKSKFEENEIINIRKHLNQFYENKKKLSLNSTNSNKFNEYVNEPQKNLLKDDSIKNDLLKGLLNNNNIRNPNEQNCDYYNSNYNRINKQVENPQLNLQNNDINNVYNFNNIHLNNKSYSNSNYNDKIDHDNFINENKPKYNFRPDLIKDINKVPKSSGLNFNLNKNMNSFQFHFNQNNKNIINEERETTNQNNQINNLSNKNGFNISQNNKNNNYQNQNKYTIEDSININGLVPNTNLINMGNKNNENTGVNNITKENSDNIENERRKNDLLQMINFSSNLRINNNYSNNNNNNNQRDYQNNQQNIYCDYENFNGVQSYEGM